MVNVVKAPARITQLLRAVSGTETPAVSLIGRV
jgi:hypothetical protein